MIPLEMETTFSRQSSWISSSTTFSNTTPLNMIRVPMMTHLPTDWPGLLTHGYSACVFARRSLTFHAFSLVETALLIPEESSARCAPWPYHRPKLRPEIFLHAHQIPCNRLRRRAEATQQTHLDEVIISLLPGREFLQRYAPICERDAYLYRRLSLPCSSGQALCKPRHPLVQLRVSAIG